MTTRSEMNAITRDAVRKSGRGASSPVESRTALFNLLRSWTWIGLLTPLLAAEPVAVAPPQIPALVWEERSDWVNVQTDVSPAARGDGLVDDTVAIQSALAAVRDGMTVYFPPGDYRITAPLVLRNPKGGRWIGGLLVGGGRETRWVWDGPEGGSMLTLDGVAYTRFVGLSLDGRGRAGVGFHYHAARGFQTEVTHRHLAFRGFTKAAILEDHDGDGQALAETTFENCLFEDCDRDVAFLAFNDYDYTFDGCEFRRCGIGVDCDHGNFYIRNCHFQESRVTDVRDRSEHCSSMRRCTSEGSHSFVTRGSSVAPLTLQDCRVKGWKSPAGAVVLSRPPALLFDCSFTEPPGDGHFAGRSPVRIESEGQRLLVCANEVGGAAALTQGARPSLITLPPGQRAGVLRTADRRFLKDRVPRPGRVFDARRDFGAHGDGARDDTAAIQATIDAAAAASNHAIAYLPTGRYVVRRTLRLRGQDFSVEGSGWGTTLMWRGPEGGVLLEVREPQRLTLADMMVGAHDAGPMNNGIDIEQRGTHDGSQMTYDGVYVFGMYQKQPFRKGLRFTNLGERDVVLMPHVQGNLAFVNCGAATVLANCSFEGSVVIEGRNGPRTGMLGFQTRLATIVTHGLYLRDNQSVVMSDFYVEQADNGFLFEGGPGLPPGRATLTGAKFHSFTAEDPSRNNVLEIRNYQGQIALGPYQFYQEPKRMRLTQQGSAPVDLLIWASSWYGAKPDPRLDPAATLLTAGNDLHGGEADADSPTDRAFFLAAPAESALTKLSQALDDLRRLGEADLRLNHPEPPPR